MLLTSWTKFSLEKPKARCIRTTRASHWRVSCSKCRDSRMVSPIECALSVSKKIPDVLMSRMIPHYERDLVPATIIFHHA